MRELLKDNRGVILLLVLSIIALFTVMAVNFGADEGLDIELAYNFRDSFQAQDIARSGVEAAVTILKKDDPTYDSEDEDWGGFPEYALAASQYLKGPAFTGTITDESGKFDLNSLALGDDKDKAFRTAQFKRLFSALDIDISQGELDDLAEAVKDWVDEDDETVSDAENDYYQTLDDPYECKNGPMDSPEEILLVKGMKPEYYYGKENTKGIRDYVTVGTGGKINVNTASDVVLMSLSDSVDEALAETIKAKRPFKQPSSNWAQTLGISATTEEAAALQNKIIDIKSNVFSANMRGTMPSGAQINIKAVLNRVNNDVKIVYYRIY
ncbi:MAG TPA: type II secretion system minor pseudopilin GspK [Deltaproteobacteria bacterium]|jgi:general secretion pathway protein K|nr:type II secretion system minor pseudopilin GspK [Deltaproteobacteria bacterium]